MTLQEANGQVQVRMKYDSERDGWVWIVEENAPSPAWSFQDDNGYPATEAQERLIAFLADFVLPQTTK